MNACSVPGTHRCNEAKPRVTTVTGSTIRHCDCSEQWLAADVEITAKAAPELRTGGQADVKRVAGATIHR